MFFKSKTGRSGVYEAREIAGGRYELMLVKRFTATGALAGDGPDLAPIHTVSREELVAEWTATDNPFVEKRVNGVAAPKNVIQ